MPVRKILKLAVALLLPAITAHAGSFTTLHRFAGAPDAADPISRLVFIGGTLYGTTFYGGPVNRGTVFSVNATSGKEKLLYSPVSQESDPTDPQYPAAALLSLSGKLYGTSYWGGSSGASDACLGAGCGTVFSVDPATGAESVVYSFLGGTDGELPQGGSLIAHLGVVYGTTYNGGNGVCSNGCGTVFSLNPNTGAETVLYQFQGTQNSAGPFDGTYPESALIYHNGALYGATAEGGNVSSDGCAGNGCGVIFKVNATTGVEKLLYRGSWRGEWCWSC